MKGSNLHTQTFLALEILGSQPGQLLLVCSPEESMSAYTEILKVTMKCNVPRKHKYTQFQKKLSTQTR